MATTVMPQEVDLAHAAPPPPNPPSEPAAPTMPPASVPTPESGSGSGKPPWLLIGGAVAALLVVGLLAVVLTGGDDDSDSSPTSATADTDADTDTAETEEASPGVFSAADGSDRYTLSDCSLTETGRMEFTTTNVSDNPIDLSLDLATLDTAGATVASSFTAVVKLPPGATETQQVRVFNDAGISCTATVSSWNSYAQLSLPVRGATCSVVGGADGPEVLGTVENSSEEVEDYWLSVALMRNGERVGSKYVFITDAPASGVGEVTESLGALFDDAEGLTCEVLDRTRSTF